MKRLLLIAAAAVAASGAHAETIVTANSAAPGDDFTNSTTTNTTAATPGAALGTSNWYYNNVRNNGHVGIRTDLPRSGNGSVWFSATQGPSGNSSKADIEYYNVVGGAVQSLGKLGSLSALGYDWYRASGGTAEAWLHPSLRLYVANSARTQAGYLVFERIYNGLGNGPTDQWVTEDVFGGNYRMWSTGNLPLAFTYGDNTKLVTGWMANYGDYDVLGISAGVGSGWGTAVAGVDNITVGFGSNVTTYNFEVVPEPASILALVSGLGGLLLVKRRR